jgi:hypothetical protein
MPSTSRRAAGLPVDGRPSPPLPALDAQEPISGLRTCRPDRLADITRELHEHRPVRGQDPVTDASADAREQKLINQLLLEVFDLLRGP